MVAAGEDGQFLLSLVQNRSSITRVLLCGFQYWFEWDDLNVGEPLAFELSRKSTVNKVLMM